MKKRTHRDYLEDISEEVDNVASFIEGMSKQAFIPDKKTINAVTRSLEVIGEAAKKIPDSVKEKYPSLPWRKMTGMRDKLIHEYFGIDLEILWATAAEDVPKLRVPMDQLLSESE